MKNKRFHVLYLAAVILLSLAIVGTVAAYMFRVTQTEENLFVPAEVSCQVHETTDDAMTQKTGITVENTSNISAYLRLRLVTYWVDISTGTAQIVSKPSEMPDFDIAAGWIRGSDDTYYYTSPVSPDGFTSELLASGSVIPLAEEDGYLQVVEVFAEAIQYLPYDAVENSWHVTLNGDGIITRVP